MKHVPELDGVRGLAVLMVVLFHTAHLGRICAFDEAVWRATRGLDSGVDLFFVLSGFLITGILLDAKDKVGYFRTFYARRTLRIFPLYYAVVTVCVFLPIILPSVQRFGLPRLSHGGCNYWLYVSNMWTTGLHPMLGVAWSLSIEEQFYLVWPLLVYLLSSRKLVLLCAINLGVSLTYRLLCEYTSWGLLSRAPVARLDVLSMGALIAIAIRGGLPRLSLKSVRIAAAVACILEFALIVYEHGPWGKLKWSIGISLMGIVYAWILAEILMGPSPSVVNRAFGNSVLRCFGKYSYAIYFIHSPLDAVLRQTIFPLSRFVAVGGTQVVVQAVYWLLVAVLSLGVAWAVWHAYEKHFLALKGRFEGQRAMRPSTLDLQTNPKELQVSA